MKKRLLSVMFLLLLSYPFGSAANLTDTFVTINTTEQVILLNQMPSTDFHIRLPIKIPYGYRLEGFDVYFNTSNDTIMRKFWLQWADGNISMPSTFGIHWLNNTTAKFSARFNVAPGFYIAHFKLKFPEKAVPLKIIVHTKKDELKLPTRMHIAYKTAEIHGVYGFARSKFSFTAFGNLLGVEIHRIEGSEKKNNRAPEGALVYGNGSVKVSEGYISFNPPLPPGRYSLSLSAPATIKAYYAIPINETVNLSKIKFTRYGVLFEELSYPPWDELNLTLDFFWNGKDITVARLALPVYPYMADVKLNPDKTLCISGESEYYGYIDKCAVLEGYGKGFVRLGIRLVRDYEGKRYLEIGEIRINSAEIIGENWYFLPLIRVEVDSPIGVRMLGAKKDSLINFEVSAVRKSNYYIVPCTCSGYARFDDRAIPILITAVLLMPLIIYALLERRRTS
ncbi:hypothetical protein [Thermococcus barophilus]|uniref:Uncharacterized protein n=1 Tax=Thermococcus barophilus TaxID=55802 RepID=A0A0S1XFL3_THEBA|nr:hypothetical protein [Thermococcus barophilus]ALM76530.1 conserved exported hypothetical protein [Thermococcus barophilus]